MHYRLIHDVTDNAWAVMGGTLNNPYLVYLGACRSDAEEFWDDFEGDISADEFEVRYRRAKRDEPGEYVRCNDDETRAAMIEQQKWQAERARLARIKAEQEEAERVAAELKAAREAHYGTW